MGAGVAEGGLLRLILPGLLREDLVAIDGVGFVADQGAGVGGEVGGEFDVGLVAIRVAVVVIADHLDLVGAEGAPLEGCLGRLAGAVGHEADVVMRFVVVPGVGVFHDGLGERGGVAGILRAERRGGGGVRPECGGDEEKEGACVFHKHAKIRGTTGESFNEMTRGSISYSGRVAWRGCVERDRPYRSDGAYASYAVRAGSSLPGRG